ncbi:MAG: 16S rRNA (guanine(527)-N(7))-methyltransferase RsmG [Fibromonadales bacterium]|nr:16S rRNA (guanine(527)-N(7))-methyltransferase RsmG [Fibromonadales bacterium]
MSAFLSFAKEHNLTLPENFLDKISKFCELLLEANKTTNLVSKNDEQKLMTRHVADSLIFASFFNSQLSTLNSQLSTLNFQLSTLNSKIIWTDIGSGAGFPVVPLCVYFPQMKFFAVESRKKRCEFLHSVKQKLDLQNLEIIQGTVGTKKFLPLQHLQIDIVSCRAVGSLSEDFERAKTLLKKGGHFLTLKSKRIVEENAQLLKHAKIWNYRLPQEEMEYALVHLL